MQYIAALDVGTTTVRCFILNENCEIKGSSKRLVELLNPEPGYFEIEPEALWRKIIAVIEDAVKAAQIRPDQISCFGISSQRCTFLTWNHLTQEYYHNFITWKDLRADSMVDEWNDGYTLKTLNGFSYALYLLTRSNRFLAGSVLKMMNGQVTLRLLHEIQRNHRLKEAIKLKKARMELLDSWILYKLRSGNGKEPNVEHISDVTSCTATGLFDPFILNWSPIMNLIFGIQPILLPKIVNNICENLGFLHPDCFMGLEWKNTHIPITSSISDQTAAIFGNQCFNKDDVKITMGTGAFLNLITGSCCQASLKGMYPLVAWQFNKQTIYCVEGAAHDIGTIIAWGQQCGLYTDPTETSSIAESVKDSDGVFFIPAFSGLGAPLNDHKAASGFIGIKPSTRRAHLIRALLESIVFRLVLLCETAEQETKRQIKLLRVDGGVSRNSFICQFLADTSGKQVERPLCSESSIMGACYAAGFNYGLWKDLNEIKKFRKIDRLFKPCLQEYEVNRKLLNKWLDAVNRFKNWY
uniref:Glycerol kinase 5 n=1 Tax=Glossina brevipalpis TaxID=37001 RepID=A0A1A9W3H6_9MUSC